MKSSRERAKKHIVSRQVSYTLSEEEEILTKEFEKHITEYSEKKYTDINGTDYPRYIPVSDWHEYSVWDIEESRDLFPTKKGNRMRDFHEYCDKETAQMIADALNRMG